VSKDKSKEAAVTPHDNSTGSSYPNNHASSIPSVDEELDPYDWHDTFEQKDLNMIKFMLENGGVSPSRSYDDANSILRYMKQVVTAAYLPRQKVVEAMKNPKGHVLGERFCDVCNVLAEIRETLKLSDKEGSKHTRY
jgi:hypothetical protein